MGKKLHVLTLAFVVAIAVCVLATANTDATGQSGSLKFPPGCPYPGLGIELDGYGVPTIHADSVEAAYFGAGYVQAYHRLVQLDVTRRMGRGELAAMVGDGYLENDRTMRRLRLDEVAEESLKLYDESELAPMDAYSAGVNLYISNCAELPMEFLGAGAPREWAPADTLVCAKVMSWMLMDDFYTTMYWERMKNRLEPGLLKLVDLPGTESLLTHVSMTDLASYYGGQSGNRVEGEERPSANAETPAPHPGSNCFVVSGRLTEDGRPWLASDPHLELTFPSIWFEMRYDAPGLSARGMSIPGTPIIVIGSNRYAAWGITALGGDVADAVRFEVRGMDTDDPEYLTAKGWKRLERGVEEYKIMSLSGAKSDGETIYYTDAGPVFFIDGGKVTALQWVGGLPDREGAAFLALNEADTLADIRSAVDEMTTSQNFLFCTLDGHIGYIPAGRYPVRAYDGSAVVDGSSVDCAWRDFLTANDFPAVLDPSSGYIVSANQQVFPSEAKLAPGTGTDGTWSGSLEGLLGGYRSYGHRAQRISQCIEETVALHPVSVTDIRRIQCDTYSIMGAGFRDFAMETFDASGYTPGTAGTPLHAAYAMLRDWDGRCDADSAGACVAFLMLEKTADRILAPRGYRNTYERAWNEAFDFGRKLGKYWDDPKTGQVEDASAILSWAIEEAAAHLENTLGEPDDWRWDRLHFMDLSYPVPLLGSYAPGLVGSAGGYDTPWQGSSAMNDKGYLIQDFAPSMRMIATPGDGSGNFFSVLPGGESGNVMDKHSKDQLELFLKGEYK